jgi:DNA-binding LacI/PurR family transcriptional regulator
LDKKRNKSVREKAGAALSGGEAQVNINSKTVAKMAGVSQATVSRVFNSQVNIREETKRRVLDAGHKLGYYPNAIARSLTSRKSNLVAVVSIGTVNPYYHSNIVKISSEIQKSGRQTLFFVSPKEQELDDILAQILQYQVDAVIVLSAVLSTQMTRQCARVQVPVVVFNKYTVNKNVLSVCSDNVGAGWLVANYLYEKGHQKYAFIGSETFSGTSSDRQKGFLDCLAEKGIGNCIVRNVPYTYRDGYEAMRSILQDASRPDAVFCAGDLMALGALDVARSEFGMDVPRDIAIIGFDNIPDASFEAYHLTTVEQKIDEMVRMTFDYLNNRLSGNSTVNGVHLFDCRIIERSSG